MVVGSEAMTDGQRVIAVCRHCGATLRVWAEDDAFGCPDCDGDTPLTVGIALATSRTAEATERNSRWLPAKILAGVIGVLLIGFGSYMQLHDGRLPWTPKPTVPVVVVTTSP